MSTTFDAIYENGVLRPLQPVVLAENQRVTVTVQPLGSSGLDAEFVEWCKQQPASSVTIDEVREILSKVPDSLSDAIINERDRECRDTFLIRAPGLSVCD